jgi:glycosyltransferase involved in cell wall biosynthesis
VDAPRGALIAVSEGSRAEIARRYGPRRSLWVTNCPPRWSGGDGRDRLREALGLAPGTPIVLYHGGFMEGRGIELMAAALLRPELADVHGVFLGYGQLRGTIERWVADPRYAGRIHLLDAVPIDELLAWVTTADVGLSVFQPETMNYRLTLSNKLFETIAAGVPVIASDFPQYREVLLDDPAGPLGAVVDPGDPAALASAIRSIVDRSPEEKRAARERATRAAGDRWNWETESGKLLALYDDLIGSA